MARTIIGRLIIQMTQSGADKTARDLKGTFDSIENRARRFGDAKWGTGFQKQLDRLKLSPQELAAVKQSWERIPTTVSGALKRDTVGAWKNGVLGHFAEIESRAKTLRKSLRETFSGPAAAVVLGYGAVTVGRNAAVAGAERDRATFRMEQAGIPEEERTQILDRSEELTAKYPGMSMTEIMELALRARSTMGDIDRTLGILEGLVQGQVVLMSAFGPDSGDGIMSRIVKAGDVLGQNEEGPKGIQNMLQIIDGLVRAGQVEGSDFDPGSILEFSRRGKTAGAGWSTEFLSTTAPVLIQDQGGPQAGNALAMAFKSFVLGDNSMNGKVYRQRQAELGLRDNPGGELVGGELMTSDPFAWVEEYLRPALERAGVDVEDEGEVTRQVGRLSGNSNATASFTRMLTQFEQIMKSRELYANALGLGAAEDVGTRDPFVAWRGMLNSFSNFTGAIAENVDIITPGLSAISGAINSFSAAVRENPLQALGLGGLAAGAAGVGAWKVGVGITGLISAGPSLQTAAVMLQGAATSLGRGSAAGAAGAASGAKPTPGRGGTTLMLGAPFIAEWIGNQIMGPVTPEQQEVKDGAFGRVLGRIFPPGAAPAEPDGSPYDHLRAGAIDWGVNPDATTVDTTEITAAQANVDALAQKLGSLGSTVIPHVDPASLLGYLSLLNTALQKQAMLGKIGTGPRARPSIEATFSDYGIAP